MALHLGHRHRWPTTILLFQGSGKQYVVLLMDMLVQIHFQIVQAVQKGLVGIAGPFRRCIVVGQVGQVPELLVGDRQLLAQRREPASDQAQPSLDEE